jgi:O-antigen/teichoic acid export membrane protein
LYRVDTIEDRYSQVDILCMPVTQQSLPRRLSRKIFQPSIWQALIVLLDQGFYSITNFLASILLARACSKSEYGLYVLGFTLLVIAMDIQVSLSGIPFTVLSPKLKHRDRRLYLGSTLIQHLAVSILVAVGFTIAALVLSTTDRIHGFSNVLFTLAVASVFVLLRDFMRFVLLSQFRVWAGLLMGLIVNVTTIGLLFWVYFGDRLTVPIGYLIMAACSGFTALSILLKERKQIGFTIKMFSEHIRNNWTFGKWLVAQAIADFLAIRLYPWALMLFKDSSVVAAYGVCVIFAGILNPLLMGLSRFLGPQAAYVACNKSSRIHYEIYYWMILIATPLLIFLLLAFIFGERIIVAIYGSKFVGLGYIFSIYLLSHVITAECIVICAGTNALKRPDISFRAQIAGLTATIIVGLFLAYRWGALGAVIGVCISRFAAFVYQFTKFKSLAKV